MKNANTGRLGFTLIELLVVVLIIGILAAVALPHYRKAVAKSRFVQLQVAGDALAKSQQLYFLANNTYADKLDQLDILPEGTLNASATTITLKNEAKCFFNNQYLEFVCTYGSSAENYPSMQVPLFMYYFTSQQKRCRAYSELQKQICLSVGGKYVDAGNSYVDYRLN